jgi:inhibitor of KinA sporulation pathway (predicted exonuclease)
MRGGAMLQRVTIFDTLDEEFIENLCQCDPEVLQQLIHMWGQCHSNQKRAERSTTQETVNPSVTIKVSAKDLSTRII